MIDSLKQQVEDILNRFPKSRDSDQWLTIKLWTVYYPSRIHRTEPVDKPYIFLSDIMEMPREDNIKRVRAIIQNVENKFLPTSLWVVKKRKINEEVWREYILKNNG